jgi:pyridoxal/pyridoxine/pyridoxamine kinase
VGNRAAVFSLQTLGFNADFVNTVQFSNHTGYPLFKGSHTSREQLQDLADGLHANGGLQRLLSSSSAARQCIEDDSIVQACCLTIT